MSPPESPSFTRAGTRTEPLVTDPTKIEFYLRQPEEDHHEVEPALLQKVYVSLLYVSLLAVLAAAVAIVAVA